MVYNVQKLRDFTFDLFIKVALNELKNNTIHGIRIENGLETKLISKNGEYILNDYDIYTLNIILFALESVGLIICCFPTTNKVLPEKVLPEKKSFKDIRSKSEKDKLLVQYFTKHFPNSHFNTIRNKVKRIYLDLSLKKLNPKNIEIVDGELKNLA